MRNACLRIGNGYGRTFSQLRAVLGKCASKRLSPKRCPHTFFGRQSQALVGVEARMRHYDLANRAASALATLADRHGPFSHHS